MARKILVAYEDRHHPVEMDVSDRSEREINKIKEVLQRVGRTWKIKDSH